MENGHKTSEDNETPPMNRNEFFGMLDLLCELLPNQNCHISRFTEKTPTDILQGRHILFKPLLIKKKWCLTFTIKGNNGVWALATDVIFFEDSKEIWRFRKSSSDMIAFSSQPASPPMFMIFPHCIITSVSKIPEVSLFGVLYALCLSTFPELYILGQATELFDTADFDSKQYSKLVTLYKMRTAKKEPFSLDFLVQNANRHQKLFHKISKEDILSAEWKQRADSFLKMINSEIIDMHSTLEVVDKALDFIRCNFNGELRSSPSPGRIVIAPLRQFSVIDDEPHVFPSDEQIVLPIIYNDQTLLFINFKIKDDKTFDTRVIEVRSPKLSRAAGYVTLVRQLSGIFTRTSRLLPNPIISERYRLELNPLLMVTLTLFFTHHYSLYNNFSLSFLPKESLIAAYGYHFTACMKSIKKGDAPQFSRRLGRLFDVVDLSFGPVR